MVKEIMLGNNGKGKVATRDLWQTPNELFNELNKQYQFNFDCCASEENKKCSFWHNDFEMVSMEELRNKTAWMNPPFSIARRMFTHFFNVINKGVAIYRCDNLETGLWQNIIFPNAEWIFIPNKRVSYEILTGEGVRFPSALIGVGIEPPTDLKGTIVKVLGSSKQGFDSYRTN